MGRVCVITGASQGIGRAAAIRMSQEPDVSALVLIARNGTGLEETAAAMAQGKEVELIAYDLMDLDGIPIAFTVLKGHEYVEDLLERDELVNVQLPQKFDRAALVAAHEAARRDGATFTEDASLFHRYAGAPVRILPGSERNIKITVPTDIVTAEAIYADVIGRRG